MSRLTDLATDLASVPDLAKVPYEVTVRDESELGGMEQDADKIEIDLGDVVVSIFHRNGTYGITEDGLKKGWHFMLTTYSKVGEPVGPQLVAEDAAIDKIAQYVRERVKNFT